MIFFFLKSLRKVGFWIYEKRVEIIDTPNWLARFVVCEQLKKNWKTETTYHFLAILIAIIILKSNDTIFLWTHDSETHLKIEKINSNFDSKSKIIQKMSQVSKIEKKLSLSLINE